MEVMATTTRKCDDLNEFVSVSIGFVCVYVGSKLSAVPYSDCDGALIADVQKPMSLCSWRLDGVSACHGTAGI